MSTPSLHDLLLDLHTHSPLWNHPELPFSSRWELGHPQLAVVTGDNATGKSLFVQMLAGRAKKAGLSPLSLSIRERTGSGLSEMAGMRRAMMFGDETEQSTGSTSFSSLRGAFRSVAVWSEEGQSPIIVLDEPEMGLSEGYAAAMGTWLAEQVQALPERVAGVVVVTHSKPLVAQIMERLDSLPTWVAFGPEPDLDAWLRHHTVRDVSELLELEDVSRTNHRTVMRILDELRSRNKPAPGPG